MSSSNKLGLLKRIILEINQGKSYQEIMEIAYDQLKNLIPFNRVAIAILDKRGLKLVLTALKTDGDIALPVGYIGKVEGSSLETLIKHGKSRIINDLEDYLKKHPESDSTRRIVQEGMLSNLTLPLIASGKPIGVIFFSSRKRKAFDMRHEKLVEEIAGEMAITVEKALLMEELSKQNRELLALNSIKSDQVSKAEGKYRTLLEISNAINFKLDVSAVFKTVVSELRRLDIFSFDRASIALLNEAKGLFRFVALEPEHREILGRDSTVKADGSALGLAVEKKEPVVDEDIVATMKFSEDGLLAKAGIRSRVVLPLVLKGKAIGTFNVASSTPRSYTKDELEFLKEIAAQITIAVSTAKAYQEISRLKNELQQENVYLRDELVREHHFYEIVGSSPALLFALRQAERVANTDSTVLIRGDTGTGKELIARAIHRLSLRRDRSLIKVNCSALPPTLIESELFGHERGAFTGAHIRKIGRFELASSGTLFLDEIADIPPEIQIKLLRAIQEKEIERVGGQETISVDVRIVTATNRDIEKMLADGSFREDLYYRLNVFPIFLPPLRERKEDIKELTLHFIDKYSKKINKRITKVSPEVLDKFYKYDWPGNVRELENIIERAVILCDSDSIESSHISFLEKSGTGEPRGFKSLDDLEKYIAEARKNYLIQILKATHGRVYGPNGAAKLLSIKPTTLLSRLKKLGIERHAQS